MKSELHFAGDEIDKDNKVHHISRVTCTVCSIIRSEYHNGCCGYDNNGWYSTNLHEHD